MGLIDRIAQPGNLQLAWQEVLANDLDDGELSRAADEFASEASGRLQAIAGALGDGTYQPASLHAVEIPSGEDGDVRHLSIPALRDRIVERAIVQVVSPLLDPSFTPWSFAYRPGLGVADALRALVGRRDDGCRFVVRTDVRDCFDSLDRARLIEVLEKAVPDPWLSLMVQKLLDRPTRTSRGQRRAKRGVPQGGPLSPLLANLYLHDLDRRMLTHGYTAVRYADDIAIPVLNEDEAERALEVATVIARDIGLELGPEKTAIMSFDEGFAFLGEDVNDRYPDAVTMTTVKEPDRRALYVASDGATVRMAKGHIVVSKGDVDLLSAPVTQVGSIALYGAVGLSAAVRQHALANGVAVAFMSRRGNFQGVLHSGTTRDVSLLRAQIRMTGDVATCTEVSKRFVDGKLANLRALLLRFADQRNARELSDAATQIEGHRLLALRATDIDMVRGHEGAASAVYFEHLGRLLPEGIKFTLRTRNPPLDPVNSALSFGYTLLTAHAATATAVAGLDPAIGFLHADAPGRPSLALDLVEEYRPLVVDQAVVRAFRKGTLAPEHFRTDERNGGVLLTDKGRKRFLAALETRLLETFTHPTANKKVSYRRSLLLQARQIARLIRAGEVEYQPIRWRT